MGLGLAPSGSQDGTLTTLAITAISPASGSTLGGETVTITGRGFELGMTAKINGVLCTSLVVTSANTLTCVTPAGSYTGSGVAVRLDRTTTAANATLAGGFTYAFSPSVLSPVLAYYSDTGTTGSPAITAWTNQGSSGAANDLSNTGAPTISSSGGPNGEPRINAVGSAAMSSALFAVTPASGISLWIVYRVNSPTVNSVIHANERLFFYSDTSGRPHLFSQTYADIQHTTATATGGWQCIELLCTGWTGAVYANASFGVDGARDTGGGLPGLVYAAGGTLTNRLGGNSTTNVTSNAAADVDIACVIHIQSEVTGGNLALMRAWLLDNYGVTA